MIAIQRAVSASGVPPAVRLQRWARAALGGRSAEITIRVVGPIESRRLNREFRRKDKPTNVLSFPYSFFPGPGSRVPGPVFGDVVLCAAVIAREARGQGKSAAAHWAHMVVHGVLHLRGFDHRKSSEARVMEARERAILARLSFPDPYA